MTRLEDALREALDSGVDGGTGSMLADVRRGARRRRARRRAVGAVVATSALVAAVMVGGSVLTGEDASAPGPSPVGPATDSSPMQSGATESSPPSDPTGSDSPGGPVTGLPPPGSVPTTIPADFPLAEGLPTSLNYDGFQRLEPSRDEPPLTFSACGTTADLPPARNQLTAGFSYVEFVLTRQLTTYADANEAIAALRAIVEVYASCPVETPEPPMELVRDVERSGVGGESWVLYSEQGSGLQITHVIRVGLAVLVLQDSAHGGQLPESHRVERLTRMTTAADDTVAAMCRFTADGC